MYKSIIICSVYRRNPNRLMYVINLLDKYGFYFFFDSEKIPGPNKYGPKFVGPVRLYSGEIRRQRT